MKKPRASKFNLKPQGRGCRIVDKDVFGGTLQFIEDGKVVESFMASYPYWTLRTYWVQGKIDLPTLRKKVKEICEG